MRASISNRNLVVMEGSGATAIAKPLKRRRASNDAPSSRLVGSPDWLGRFNQTLARIAASTKTVMLVGETGTGKSLVAQEIARMAGRTGRFVEVNCAAIPETLIELRLFGSVPGAFTDAKDMPGVLEAAEGGTLFLDEIGELDYEVQAKLLRVLQERAYSRLGATVEQQVTCRIIVASNRNLEEAVENRTFRADLYYRLNVIKVNIPPLRERAQDVPRLFDHYCRESDDRVPPLSAAAMGVLCAYEWPGNVRELINVVERLGVIGDPNQEITPEDLDVQFGIRPSDAVNAPQFAQFTPGVLSTRDIMASLEGKSLENAVDSYQKAIIVKVLKRTAGNMSKTSRFLDVARTTLIERCRKLGIARGDWDLDAR